MCICTYRFNNSYQDSSVYLYLSIYQITEKLKFDQKVTSLREHIKIAKFCCFFKIPWALKLN